jgi:glycosyltransferase involved in cell wall biosynthesis
MKTIVISAVNLRKGGTLTILRNCLEYLSQLDKEEFRIVALVHRKDLAKYPNIEYIEIPWAMDNWIWRLWCEYVTMKRISKRLQPIYLWLSLHDTTPNVEAERQGVYCQTSFPFYKWKFHDVLFDYKIVLFSLFTRYAYKINIHRNRYLIVQQQSLRRGFSRIFKVEPSRFIVAPPELSHPDLHKDTQGHVPCRHFLFVSTPDVHKNFETLCRATELLENEIGKNKMKVSMTISGDENRYAKYLKRHWGKVSSIEFAGFMKKERLYEYYRDADCLIFPSKVETWGLPISEFAVSGKPMLLADLPYAHETAGGSERTAFFNPFDAHDLKDKMRRLIEGDASFLAKIEKKEIESPLAHTWAELFNLLLE